MGLRNRTAVLALIAAFACAPALAEGPDDEIKRLQLVLSILNQELVAQYEQLKAIQQSLRSGAETFSLRQQGRSPYPVSHEEATAEASNALRRESAMSAQLDAVISRINQIEQRKQPILERLYEIVGSRPPPAAPAPSPSPYGR